MPRRPSSPAALFLAAASLLLSCIALPGTPPPPRFSVSGDTPAFALGPRDLVVYAIRRVHHSGQFELEHDDVWLASLHGKKSRIFNGPKSFSALAPSSYAIRSFSWNPSGHDFIIDMDRL